MCCCRMALRVSLHRSCVPWAHKIPQVPWHHLLAPNMFDLLLYQRCNPRLSMDRCYYHRLFHVGSNLLLLQSIENVLRIMVSRNPTVRSWQAFHEHHFPLQRRLIKILVDANIRVVFRNLYQIREPSGFAIHVLFKPHVGPWKPICGATSSHARTFIYSRLHQRFNSCRANVQLRLPRKVRIWP